MLIEKLQEIEGVKKVHIGKNNVINDFYISDIFGHALGKINKDDCLISVLESFNALHICHLKKASTFVLCETQTYSEEMKEMAIKYDINFFTYDKTSVQLINNINKN